MSQFKFLLASRTVIIGLLITFTILPFNSLEAKKLVYPFQIVVGLSDLVVQGEITGITGNTYTFSISRTIKGISNKSISVQMFKEWTCDQRVRRAEIGQELLLFLTENKGVYDIINGSTGEIFIVNNELENFYQPNVTRKIDDVLIAVGNFVKSYHLVTKEFLPSEKNIFNQLVRDEEISSYKTANTFSEWLFNMDNFKIAKKA